MLEIRAPKRVPSETCSQGPSFILVSPLNPPAQAVPPSPSPEIQIIISQEGLLLRSSCFLKTFKGQCWCLELGLSVFWWDCALDLWLHAVLWDDTDQGQRRSNAQPQKQGAMSSGCIFNMKAEIRVKLYLAFFMMCVLVNFCICKDKGN